MSIAAGQLRSTIKFERLTESGGTFGDASGGSWGTITGTASTRARITPIRAAERVTLDQTSASSTHKITVRRTIVTATVTAKDRITDENTGAVYNLQGPPINIGGRDRLLEFVGEVKNG